MYEAKILADSISEAGARLTTMQVTFPRIVLAEFNTHRMFSRNSASSRAIPVEKQIQRVLDDPFIPVHWGKNQKGMQAEQELDAHERAEAAYEWLLARDRAVASARDILALGVHKQITNRLLEPWMWQTVIVSATEWQNFFALRCHKDAQPEIRHIAEMMRVCLEGSEPLTLREGWHMPLVTEADTDDLSPQQMTLVSVGRCARVSYLTHDGKRDPRADIDLAKKLQMSGHMSPFEHVASPLLTRTACGNFVGWCQLRKTLPDEAVWVQPIKGKE